MHLVDVGQRAELGGQVAHRLDRAEVAVHRVDALEGDELRGGGVLGLQERAQVGHVVVAPDPLLAAAPDALDHGGVVEPVGKGHEAGDELGQGRERRVVGDVGGGEDERGLLAVEVGELRLQPLVVDRGARDVARAARARARGLDRLVHGRGHRRVLAHAEVVVAAPHRDVARAPVGPAPDRIGKGPRAALDVDEGAVAPLLVEPLQRGVQHGVVAHARSSPRPAPGPKGTGGLVHRGMPSQPAPPQSPRGGPPSRPPPFV